MNIRLFTFRTHPASPDGGLQVLALRLAQHLQKLGHGVRLVARITKFDPSADFMRTEPPRRFTLEGVEVEIAGVEGWRRLLLAPARYLLAHQKTFFLGRLLHAAAFRPALDRVLQGADVAHFIGTGGELFGFAVQAAARSKKIPFLVEPAIHPVQRGDAWTDWLLYRSADTAIAHTGSEAGYMRERGVDPARVHVLRHGFDALPPGDGGRFRKTHDITGPTILFIGRRCDEKGYFTLLEAFALLHREMPHVTLIVIGPGDLPPSTAPGVRELGRVSDEVRMDALSACDVFCLPSKGESFGMAYFEAWHCSRPVVALDLPVCRETIGASGGGLLAARRAPEAIAEQLRYLLDHPEEAADMGRRGEEFSRRFTWDEAALSCLEAYDRARVAMR